MAPKVDDDTSKPTSTPAPTRPMASPRMRRQPWCSPVPVSTPMTTPMSGTVDTSRPESELEMCNSASERSTHGIPISMTVYATIHPQRPSNGPTLTRRLRAIGTRSTAPSANRTNTRSTGPKPRSATLMSRYGIPQITHIATKRTSPRLLMASDLLRCAAPHEHSLSDTRPEPAAARDLVAVRRDARGLEHPRGEDRRHRPLLGARRDCHLPARI